MAKAKPALPALAAVEGELVPATQGNRPAVRVAKLDTAKAVSRELARLYKAARRGEVDPAVAARLAYTANILIGSLKVSSLEERLDRLEDAARLKRLPALGDDPDASNATQAGETGDDQAQAEAEHQAAIGDEPSA